MRRFLALLLCASLQLGMVFVQPPVATTITGTANQVTVTTSSGAVTLSLPQSIATTSAPTFGGLTLTGTLALGSISVTGTPTIASAWTWNAAQTLAAASLVKAGTGTGTSTLGGVLYASATSVGNVGAGEDTLMSYSLPANTLSANNKVIRVTAYFRTAANGNAKTITGYFGTGSATLISAGAWNAVTGIFNLLIVRTASNAQDIWMWGGDSSGPTFRVPTLFSTTETDTAAITIKFTGEATADNDVVQRIMVVEMLN